MRRNKAAGDRPQEDLKPTLSTAGNAEGGAAEKIYFGEKQNLRRQAGRKPVSRKKQCIACHSEDKFPPLLRERRDEESESIQGQY